MPLPTSVTWFLASLTLLGVTATMPVTPRDDELARAAWLAGCWELATPGRTISEQWMAPRGAMMLGMSRTVVGDTVREYEFIRIEMRNGRATYVAQPSRQAITAFPATTWSDSLMVFTNDNHDFPQRISYRRVRQDSLVARIEGAVNGQLRSVNFPMGRVSCAPDR